MQNHRLVIVLACVFASGFCQESDTVDDVEYNTDSLADDLTTTKAPPVTTPQPATKGTWNVTDGNTTCVKMQAAVTLIWTYVVRKPDGNDTKITNVTVSVPVSASDLHELPEPESTCNVTEGKLTGDQQLTMKFWKDWKLQLDFDQDKDMFTLSHVKLTYDYDSAKFNFSGDIVGPRKGVIVSNVQSFKAPIDQSYKCESTPTKVAVDHRLTLSLAELRVQAFTNSDEFKNPQVCAGDLATSDLVPIIVGCCLAALVVIVLVAYLIGRARAQRQGYSSV